MHQAGCKFKIPAGVFQPAVLAVVGHRILEVYRKIRRPLNKLNNNTIAKLEHQQVVYH